MMRDDSLAYLFIVILIAFVPSAFIAGLAIKEESFQKEAVEIGHAEFYLDENMERQWRWLPVGDGDSSGAESPVVVRLGDGREFRFADSQEKPMEFTIPFEAMRGLTIRFVGEGDR